MINKITDELQKITNFINRKSIVIQNGLRKVNSFLGLIINGIINWFIMIFFTLETNIVKIILSIIKFVIQIKLGVYALICLIYITFYYSTIAGAITLFILTILTIIGDKDIPKTQEVADYVYKIINFIKKPVTYFVRFLLFVVPAVWSFILMFSDRDISIDFFHKLEKIHIMDDSIKSHSNKMATKFTEPPLINLIKDNQNSTLNLHLLEESCSKGNTTACNNLGVLYFQGKEVVQNRPKALIFFNQACNQGLNKGCINKDKLEKYLIK